MHENREPVDLDVLSEMGYEKRDVNMKALGKWIGAFFGLNLLFFVVGFGFYRWLAPKQIEAGRSRVQPVTRRVPAAPNPLLQNNVEAKVDIFRMRQDEVSLLTSYAYVDPRAGVVRMPIERAKDLLLARGGKLGLRETDAPVRRPDTSPRNLSGQGAADKAPGGANAGDTAPRIQIPSNRPTRDPNRNGGLSDAPTGSDVPDSNAAQGDASPPGQPGVTTVPNPREEGGRAGTGGRTTPRTPVQNGTSDPATPAPGRNAPPANPARNESAPGTRSPG